MGRASNTVKAFLQFLLHKSDILLAGGDKNRSRIRQLAKRLNLHGGVCVLDLLNEAELLDFLNEELEYILETEVRDSKEAAE